MVNFVYLLSFKVSVDIQKHKFPFGWITIRICVIEFIEYTYLTQPAEESVMNAK